MNNRAFKCTTNLYFKAEKMNFMARDELHGVVQAVVQRVVQRVVQTVVQAVVQRVVQAEETPPPPARERKICLPLQRAHSAS